MTGAGSRTWLARCAAAALTFSIAPSPAPAGQAPAQSAVPAPPAADVRALTIPAGAQGYTYDPEGRRDPFVSLLHRGTDSRGPVLRREGIGGVGVDELALRGIVHSRGTYVAMIQAPDGKSYTIRAGDRLMDGAVKAVTPAAVVFVQQVNDPLSLVKQREIRKLLRPSEEAK